MVHLPDQHPALSQGGAAGSGGSVNPEGGLQGGGLCEPGEGRLEGGGLCEPGDGRLEGGGVGVCEYGGRAAGWRGGGGL